MVKVIGVDVGGTFVRAGIVEKGKITNYIKEKIPSRKKKILEKVTEVIKKLDSKTVKGIGVAVPGFTKNGIVYKTPNLDFDKINLKKILKEKFNKKVEVGNDAKCVALSELKFGIKKKNFFVLILGTGVGGAAVLGGKIYFGKGYAGEVGHIIVDGNKDFESLWKKDLGKMKKVFGRNFLMEEAIKRKDKKSKILFDKMYEDLAKGVGTVFSLFDPEKIILMGGIRKAGKEFTNGIKKKVRKDALNPTIPEIKWSKVKHPGVLGAGLLVGG